MKFCGLMQVGSADHHIHYYDLRNISSPLHVFSGHKKAVSYVKFLSETELASASTDSTLRLWDVKENLPVSNVFIMVQYFIIVLTPDNYFHFVLIALSSTILSLN